MLLQVAASDTVLTNKEWFIEKNKTYKALMMPMESNVYEEELMLMPHTCLMSCLLQKIEWEKMIEIRFGVKWFNLYLNL